MRSAYSAFEVKMENYKRVKYACYTINMSMAIIANLPPLLLLIFKDMYALSYSELGLLIAVNFFSQLSIDLVFSFFSHRFNIIKAVKITPVLTLLGLVIYALAPWIFPNAVFIGLLIGTVIFSMSGGFVEVLISPVIAAIPSDNPDREMSKLHSVYAWAAVVLTVFATVFLFIFGTENWQILALLSTIAPIVSILLFFGAKIPKMSTPEKASGALSLLKNKGLILCIVALFLSGAAELTMSQWGSTYLEMAAGIPKIWGDIFGVAFFLLFLGLGRTLYAKFGNNIERVLFFGALGAAICYLAAAISPIPVIGLFACAVSGFCISMLWPGTLLVASSRFPAGGIFVYAAMAAAGDLGSSVGPQLVGVITDIAAKIEPVRTLASSIGLAPEQAGIKIGMLFGLAFPLAALPLYYRIWKKNK